MDQPQDDPAARFRRPEDPPAQPPPAPAMGPAPTLLGMLEDTLTAPIRVGALFQAQAASAAPSYPVMVANFLFFWLAFLGINIMRVAIVSPSSLHYTPTLFATVGLSALAMGIPAGFLIAGIFHVCSRLAGGQGPFERSYQITSTLSIIGVLQSLCNWFPNLWVVPGLFGALLSVSACRLILQSPSGRTWAVFGSLTALMLGGQWASRRALDGFQEKTRGLQESAQQAGQLLQQLQQMQQTLIPGATSGLTLQGMTPDGLEQMQKVMRSLQAGGPSGLDLLQAPGGQPLAPGQAATPEQTAAMRMKAVDMVGAAMPLLNNPALIKAMPPEQAKQMQALMKLLSDAQGNLQTGKPMSAQQQAQLQETVGSMMRGMGQSIHGMTPPSAQPAAGGIDTPGDMPTVTPPKRSAGSASGGPVEGQR